MPAACPSPANDQSSRIPHLCPTNSPLAAYFRHRLVRRASAFASLIPSTTATFALLFGVSSRRTSHIHPSLSGDQIGDPYRPLLSRTIPIHSFRNTQRDRPDMSALRPLRGGCLCGRNRYIIALPEDGIEEAQVLFSTERSHRKFTTSQMCLAL